MGVGVDFQPGNRSDIRFDGLIDITDEAFEAIRSGMLIRLEAVFGAIVGGAPEEEVYALWRAITAEDVRAAEQKRDAEIRLPAVPVVVEAEVEGAVAGTVTRPAPRAEASGSVIHCAVELSKGLGNSLEVLVASLAEHASRPLHIWVLARHDTARIQSRMAVKFPGVTFSWVPVRGLGGGLRTPTGERVNGVSRLLLDQLLPDVDRVVLLPVAAVATDDVAALADMELDGHVFAAPTTVSATHSSGFGVVHSAAQRLEHRTQLSASLRRTAHARHEFDFDSFTTDVMVLDLGLMRSDGFAASALPLIEEFGLVEREVLHYLAGPNRAAVPVNWSFVPTRSPDPGPGLTYWADEVKPWNRQFTPQRDLWRRYSQDA